MSLERLDLSHNRLTGQIPSEVIHLSTLEAFSFAFNDLSRRIPFDQQLTNSLIVAMLAIQSCVENRYQESVHTVAVMEIKLKERLVIDQPLFFYSFVLVSYALGFWGVVAPLCISQTWRRRNYATIDGWMNYCFEM
ncbi:receptor-like protein 15 [Ricinus communis]|uniref:Serine-threonine protein kinase, plant-type n=1 Tax=Ricinus communis TaxID=3988 RepID=B9SLK0_RICCO|nr:receptor-like protein 15 [Ricinus communis]EEF35500.1 conserved hypothetical protein [Ricinus communis]